jgi:hypothetical protein
MADLSEEFKLDFKFGGNAEFLTKLEQLMERVDARFGSVEGSITDVSEATDDMRESMEGLNDTFRDGLSGLDTFKERISDIAKSFLSIYAIRNGLERVWSFGMESMDMAAEDERSENQLKAVLKNRGQSENFAAIRAKTFDMMHNTVYDDGAMLKGAGELATYVNGVESLNSMMDILADYAAGMTGGGAISPEQMESLATGLGMAYDGNYMALRRKGFDTSHLEALDAIVENNGQWTAKDRKKYGDALSDEEIAEIRKLGGVTEQMKVDALKESLGDWKGLAEEVNKLDSSAPTKLKNRIDEIRGDLGQRLMPIYNKLVQAIDKNMPKIREFIDDIGNMFESMADALTSNIDNLFSFGRWVADIVPKIVSFGASVIKAVGKVIELKDAVKMLLVYMAVDKVREFSRAFGEMMNGNGQGAGGILGGLARFMEDMEGEDGLAGAFANLSKSAAGTAVAVAGITWGLQQIINLADAFGQWVDEVKSAKTNADEQKVRSGANDQVISAYKDYKSGKISAEEYKKKYDAIHGTALTRDMHKGSIYDIWAAADAAREKSVGKGEAKLYNTFNNTNIEQNVSVSTDLQKIGLMLNQSVRALIETQMKRNGEIALARGV